MNNDFETAREQRIVPWNDLAWEEQDLLVFRDGFPVTWGHLLFVPKSLDPSALVRCFEAAVEYGERMLQNQVCQGYNVGFNQGKAAGQTVRYPHVHLVPRRYGDTDDPVGGVRNVIPGQGNYRSSTYKIPQ